MFKLNHHYTRKEITGQLGGGTWDYLPTSSGCVVAGCFRLDMNPGAPREVLVGKGPRIQRSAEMLAKQGSPIPVFMKAGTNRWKYVGLYGVRALLSDKPSIKQYSEGSIRSDVTSVLLLDPIS